MTIFVPIISLWFKSTSNHLCSEPIDPLARYNSEKFEMMNSLNLHCTVIDMGPTLLYSMQPVTMAFNSQYPIQIHDRLRVSMILCSIQNILW